jgi:hypothetical protein
MSFTRPFAFLFFAGLACAAESANSPWVVSVTEENDKFTPSNKDRYYTQGLKVALNRGDNVFFSVTQEINTPADTLNPPSVTPPSAVVGSIGVIAVDESYEEAFKNMGIKVEVFRAGKYKAPNIGGEGYTDEQREMENETIEAMHEEFKQTVLRKRSMASRDDMEGQVFTGREAASKNLITGLASSFAEALVAFEQDA